jgi:uncharacterized protein YndB with AHSA1/START domain
MSFSSAHRIAGAASFPANGRSISIWVDTSTAMTIPTMYDARSRSICDPRCMSTLSFTVTRTIEAPPSAVWNILGDFGTEHRWTRSLVRCERDTPDVRVGTRRRCLLPKPLMGRTEVREQLTEYEPGASLAYLLDGPAGPFLTAASRWSIQTTSNGTTALTVAGTFTPRTWFSRVIWLVARLAIRRLTRNVIRELDTYVRSHRALSIR